MHKLHTSSFALAVLMSATLLVFTGTAQAAPFGDNPFGQNAAFGWNSNYTGGGHTNPGGFAMGSPTVTTDGFIFQNEFGDMNFLVNPGELINSQNRWLVSIADSANPAVQGATNPGAQPFQFVRVREAGTYESADPAADFIITQTFSVVRYLPAPAGTTPNIPFHTNIVFNPDGTWVSEYTLNVGDPIAQADLPFETIQITLTNILAVSPSAPEGTFIRKTYASVLLPEPGSLALLALGAPLVLRRRRAR